MDPRTFCEQALDDLRRGQAPQSPEVGSQQVEVVLIHLVAQTPSEQEFSTQLKLMAESAERMNRPALAAAARALLSDWKAKSAALGGSGSSS